MTDEEIKIDGEVITDEEIEEGFKQLLSLGIISYTAESGLAPILSQKFFLKFIRVAKVNSMLKYTSSLPNFPQELGALSAFALLGLYPELDVIDILFPLSKIISFILSEVYEITPESLEKTLTEKK